MPFLTGVFLLCLTGLFAVAAGHKISVLHNHSAWREPLLAGSEWRSRHARNLLISIGGLEVAVGCLLVSAPVYGCTTASFFLLAYAIDLRRLHPDETCRCFGDILGRQSATSAIRRNIILAGMATGVVLWAEIAHRHPQTRAEVSLGATIVIVAVVAALRMSRFRAPEPEEVPVDVAQ